MEKITQDGFRWNVLSKPDAIERFYNGEVLFAVYSDESEHMIETRSDLQEALDSDGVLIALEMGF